MIQNETVGVATPIWPPSAQKLDTRNDLAGISSPIWPLRAQSYRGFSTSICDMFRNRYDCCAFACCGILSYDRTRYLLTGERPISIKVRLFYHLIVPLLIFITAGYCAVYIPDKQTNEIVSSSLVTLLVLYIIFDCLSGRRDRLHQREDILVKAGTRGEQSAADIASAHSCCCGFYGEDGHMDQWNENENNFGEKKDMCTEIWKFFAQMCCVACTHSFCQVCGICALAQESREIEKLVEPRKTWIDFVTFEPFSNFYYKIVQLRISRDSNPWSHYRAVSKLSKLLIKTLVSVLTSLVFVSFLKFNTMFTWQNVLVFAATFFQAFVILYIVHWRTNKFDISLDAIIKYFASGFLLTTGLAIFFETIISIAVQILMLIVLGIAGAEEPPDQEEGDSNDSNNIMIKVGMKYPGIIILYYFINSFFLAAFVEEICKYFGYLMVEHPDFMTQETEMLLNRSEDIVHIEEEQESDNESEHEDEVNENIRSASTESNLNLTPPARNLNSVGMAITVAMVSVGLGFACCENLIYIFVYTGGNVQHEVAVLVARSFFPVHPLAAAIQSVYVCRQHLEKDETIKIGGIISPSVVLHGSFDFSLMVCAFLYEVDQARRQQEYGVQEEEEESGFISFFLALTICILGSIFFFRESANQKKRLHELEQSMQILIS